MNNIDNRKPIILTPEAEKKIKDELGFVPDRLDNDNFVKPKGPRVMVKLFTNEDDHFIKKDGTKSILFKAPMRDHHELMTTCVGMVVGMDPCCYQDERFKLSGPYCELGDWAIIPRNEGVLQYIKGQPIHIFYDDRIVGIVSDPKLVRRD